MRSMTGFGRGAAGPVSAEVRCVNHRFAEATCRLGREVAPLEHRIRRAVLSAFGRGRVEVRVEAHLASGSAGALRVDKPLAKAYHEVLKELAEDLGTAWTPDVRTLVSLPGVVSLQESAPDADSLWPDVEAALDAAIVRVRAMRSAEGEALEADLRARADELEALVSAIGTRAPESVVAARERLERRIEEVLSAGTVDPGRLEAEVALLAERAAVDEELVRLDSHLRQFRAALDESGPVGRKLDFIVQEIHREVNTIGSKAADAAISRMTIEAKALVEKLREQVQNVE